MKYHHLIGVALALGSAFVSLAQAKPPGGSIPSAYWDDPKLLEQSKQYSKKVAQEKPEIGLILKKLNLQYLHQLDSTKIYNLNLDTGVVSVMSADKAAVPVAGPTSVPGFSFGTPTAIVRSSGSNIVGEGATTVTCLFGGQLAEVAGFMASTVSRDPIGGIRNGRLVVDNFLSSKSVVDFRVLMLAVDVHPELTRSRLSTPKKPSAAALSPQCPTALMLHTRL